MDRRNFLKRAATAAGGAAAFALLPESLRAALAAPAPVGGLDTIEHVVILMQENRSFDHYFGQLKGVRGFGDLNAAQLSTGRSVFHQPGGDGGYVLPFVTDKQFLKSLDHSVDTGRLAWNRGRHDNWTAAKTPSTMISYGRDDVPFYYALADAFTICDAYHCSVMGPTDPNRLHLESGKVGNTFGYINGPSAMSTFLTSTRLDEVLGGDITTIGLDLLLTLLGPFKQWLLGDAAGPLVDAIWADPNRGEMLREVVSGLRWTTYAERLEQAGVSWRVYQEWDNYECNYIEHFATFRRVAREALSRTGQLAPYTRMEHFYGDIRAASPAARTSMLRGLENGVAALAPADRSLYDRGLRRCAAGTLVDEFAGDIANGRLPKVSWMVLPTANMEHPGEAAPNNGAGLVYQLLDTLASNLDVWQKTLFLITYDENDGFFDHVLPPAPPAGTAGEFVYDIPAGLGPRVPMIVVSPWSRGGNVCSEVFDHTSVLRFLEKWTGVAEPNISEWRRGVCGDLTSTLDLTSSTVVYPPLPEPQHADGAPGQIPAPPADQAMPASEPGVKPKRKLPYALGANVRQEPHAVTITMANAAAAGAPTVQYILYPNAFHDPATSSTQHFEVAPGRTVSASCETSGGRYDYSCYGPNGFQHRFAGDLTTEGATADVTCTGAARTLRLTFTNSSNRAATFTVKANAYRTDGPWTVAVGAGATAVREWSIGDGHGDGWYDLTATLDADAGFLRRYRGYVENGTHGRTADDHLPVNRLLPDRTMYEWGRQLVVSYATTSPAADGWIGVFPESGTGAPLRRVAAPGGSGQLALPAENLDAGTYLARYLAADGRALAPAAPFRVLETLTVAGQPTGTLAVDYLTDRPDGTNWIGVFPDPGSQPIDAAFLRGYYNYVYAPGLTARANVPLTTRHGRRLPAGDYVACLAARDGYETLLAAPTKFRIA